jgi:copper chaperone CopZ
MKNIIFALLFLVGLSAYAQKSTLEIPVSGICEMCKARIERSLDVPGIWFAEWNVETKVATVVYKGDKITPEEIHGLIANAGHDTDQKKASEEAYAKVHDCCRYRDDAVQKAHKP